jgi:hypothetical protein
MVHHGRLAHFLRPLHIYGDNVITVDASEFVRTILATGSGPEWSET